MIQGKVEKEQGVNLVERNPLAEEQEGKIATRTQTTSTPNKLTQITGRKTQKTQMYNFFVLNSLNIQEKSYVDTINGYLETLKLNGFTEYTSYLMNNAGLDDKRCSVKFNAQEGEMKLLASMQKISFVELLNTFNKVSNGNKGIKLFIVGDNVDFSCNPEIEIDALQKIIGTNNNNIVIIGLNKQENAGKAGAITKSESYFNLMKEKLGVQYIKAKNAGALSEHLNAKIYPINVGNNSALNSNINAELLFFDENNNPTAATVTVYNKRGTIYNRYGEYTNDGATQIALPPGTYYFEVRDINNGLIQKTEPKIINNSQKFKQSFYFRKVKTTVRTINKEGMPVVSTFEILDRDNSNNRIAEGKNTSQLLVDLLPERYLVKVRTANNYTFSKEVELDGKDKNYELEFKEEEKKLEITVRTNEMDIKKDVVVKVFNNDGENVYSASGGEISTVVGVGSYTVEATDSSTNTKVTKKFEVSASMPTTTVEIVFKTSSVVLDIGSTPAMLRLYDKKIYDDVKTSDKKESFALRSVSGSGKMKMNLMPGEYVVEMSNINGKQVGVKTFIV